MLRALTAHQREKRWSEVMDDFQQARKSANRAKASCNGRGPKVAEINSRLSALEAYMLEYTQLLLGKGKSSESDEYINPDIKGAKSGRHQGEQPGSEIFVPLLLVI